MKMFRLNEQTAVMPTEISEVVINDQSNSITIQMKSGVRYTTAAGYKEGVYAAHGRLVKEINEALGENSCK